MKEVSIQPYCLWNLEKGHPGIWGDKEILRTLPDKLKEEPTIFIEGLSIYERPYLKGWMEKNGTCPSQSLKIADLLNLGFDPTRLRQLHHRGMDYVFERVSPHFFHSLVKKKRLLREVKKNVSRMKFQGAILRVNPPLLIFRDRGNVYVLRRKVEGIHSQEAFDQLRTSPHLREMNRAVGIDRAMVRTLHDVRKWLETRFKSRFRRDIEDLAYFVPWDIETNLPRVHVEISGVSLDRIWIA